jgi:hypothetical protein
MRLSAVIIVLLAAGSAAQSAVAVMQCSCYDAYYTFESLTESHQLQCVVCSTSVVPARAFLCSMNVYTCNMPYCYVHCIGMHRDSVCREDDDVRCFSSWRVTLSLTVTTAAAAAHCTEHALLLLLRLQLLLLLRTLALRLSQRCSV